MLVKWPEDKVLDFIDGNIRNKTQEEYVRQNVERSLVQEYRYKREEIAVEFAIKVGSSRKRVDLIIFPEGTKHLQNEAFALIECKKEGVSPADKKEGLEQLKSYMAACPNVRYGLWTNGSDQRICLAREVHAGIITFAEITDIPIRGETIRANEAPDRHQLHPASGDNLLFAFKRWRLQPSYLRFGTSGWPAITSCAPFHVRACPQDSFI